ncbi:GntR family transcriptional regulator [Streptomyces graminilatus]|uniref:GntR family transcriptional regulator n=1 Tax=Streptomyces graminilatus TaxID=1464070 RepID=UPI0006E39C40|nr:GntR family transcriptional regulator [Streptomyces graminilatus]
MAKAAKYETVAEGIRQKIRTGTYAGGDGLIVGEVTEQYGATKATVSRALTLLLDEGLVTSTGDGWTVTESLFPAGNSATDSSAVCDAEESQSAAAPAVTDTAEELEADMAAKTGADTGSGAEVVVHAPKVLEGRVVTEHVDPNAERALKQEGVAEAYQAAKVLGRAWLEAEGRATDAKKAVAAKLVDLRQMFKFKGDPDWNGQSPEYQALAALLYRDIGADRTAQRAILHHVEDRKRAVIPSAQWDRFGVEALTRGERAGLEKKAAKALTTVDETAKATAGEARKGKATGHQLVTLAKRIDDGLSVFSTASLRVMTPAQRRTFGDQVRDARDRADALLKELAGLEE